ncbi:MAG: peptidylprolyl isomerase [Bacteroidetes bacterium]|nr:peptidylprolyl isomerase [Bacteroidota bacterium]
MTRLLLSLLLATTSLFAQYTVNDYELAKTTFTREFEGEIILPYLQSANDAKVVAALLSITHSNDTSYIPIITTLDYERFGQHIAFAIGHLPSCNASIRYLSEMIYQSDKNSHLTDCLEAYGKIGTALDYKKLINLLTKSQAKHLDGFPYAIYNFHQRGLIEDYRPAAEVLLADLYSENEQILFDALFGLARTDAGNFATKEIAEFITEKRVFLSVRNLTYAISILRKAEEFALGYTVAEKLFAHNDWKVRSEMARSAANYSFTDEGELKSYLNLLTDNNSNVSRQAAISFKQLKQSQELKEYLKSNTPSLIQREYINEDTQGELLISYSALFPDESDRLLTQFDGKVRDKYLFTIVEQHNLLPENAWSFVKGKFETVKLPDRINMVSALLSYQNELINNKEYVEYLLKELAGNEPTIISFMTFAMDSAFIHSNRESILEIINGQIENEIDNGKFAEALFSLHGIVKTIHPDFALKMLHAFRDSSCDDLVRYYQSEIGVETIPRNPEMFDLLWQTAFKYKAAKVFTEKGSFTFNFRAMTSPISVGNFVYLSEKGFYDDVVFHRVVPNFVAQVGDPSGTGWGGPGYTINSEFSPTPIAESFVGMASAGPDTEGSQWYVLHNNFPHLYGRYTMFGNVTEGMEIVNQLDQNSCIQKIELIK